MTTLNKDILLSKEGAYWTLYFGDRSIWSGYADDMIELVSEFMDMVNTKTNEEIEEIVQGMTEYR